jgi:predicted PurR-regulated permease PerM|tara:strand:- start:1924 stop:2208 length:285 start_codon:yes stop_codon:yes gene_type:complete
MEVVLVVFLLFILVLGIALFRSISIISFYRDFYDDIYNRLSLFEVIIGNVLEKEIYVSDPVIIDLVDELRSLQSFISQLEEQQTFSSLGEKIDE